LISSIRKKIAMSVRSQRFADPRRGRPQRAKSVVLWAPARSGALRTILICVGIAGASFAAAFGALPEATASRLASAISTSRSPIETAAAKTTAPAADASAKLPTQTADACDNFDFSFFNTQCVKFHERRRARPHRVATWMFAHPIAPVTSATAAAPAAPTSEQQTAKKPAQRPHEAMTRPEPSAGSGPARRRMIAQSN
jgi:hypothetical protein